MILCLVAIFIFDWSEMAIIAFVFLHTVAYSFSVGQLLMYYAAKMLESTGIVIFVNWLFTFFVAISAEFMMKGLGIGKMCLMFGGCLSVCVMILMKGIPS